MKKQNKDWEKEFDEKVGKSVEEGGFLITESDETSDGGLISWERLDEGEIKKFIKKLLKVKNK